MHLPNKDYDAIVVGSGPNGLAAAIVLQRAGLSVLLIEGSQHPGGGLRSAELTLPGYVHDICSAVHPLAVASPFFRDLPLNEYGLQFIYPPVSAAHPFDDGTVASLQGTVADTAAQFGTDAGAYMRLVGEVVTDWDRIDSGILGPLQYPAFPAAMARFGLKGLPSALTMSKRFQTWKARAFWAGMAAHSIRPLSAWATSAVGLVLLAAGHRFGWPIPKGGSQSIANALLSYFISLGGKLETGTYIRNLRQLPSSHAVMFDVTPRQLLEIAGESLSGFYQWQLRRYRYGMGVYKVDWALDDPIPFQAKDARQAGTVHIGNSFEEISLYEQHSASGILGEKPFVLLAQPSVFDATRTPAAKHTAWAYCHVPHGSRASQAEAIERQVERFAPGFRERILSRHTMDTAELENHNPNYVGGDINGGRFDLRQLFTRPALRYSPYRTSAKGLYLCSSSTPPGGGVHGMCGYHAAQRALKDIFNISLD